MNCKFKLSYKDRVGIVADISQIVAAHGLNIVFMEVVRENRQAVVYMEIEGRFLKEYFDTVMKDLKGTLDFQKIRLIDTLPQEEREDRFRVVLDNISDGVISIDREGNITTVNKVAAQVYNLNSRDVIGRNIRDFDLPQYAVLESLEGQSMKNVKQNLITPQGRYQYISTCRPLQDSSGMIVGAVEIAKDMHEIKKMAKSFSEPGQISFSDIIGDDPVIKAAIAFAQKIAVTGAPVAVRGASGTGKELFARAIHTASQRSGSFVPINCAALPDSLLESELFGYEAGTFTGGRKDGKAGLFETAREGTVFLDEIAEMSLPSQAKLLRLIQEGAVRRLGGSKEIPINARIITATNKNLEQRVEDKKFRKDLYYRISVLPIHIPPLNQRLDDIPLLVEHFLFSLTSKLEKDMPDLNRHAYEKLKKHDWPGNIRELKNVVERAAILCEDGAIDVDTIFFSHEMNGNNIPQAAPAPSALNAQVSTKQASLKSQVGVLEKKIIVNALKTHQTIRKAARMLEISHPALINKMKKYNIRKTTQIRS